MKTVCIAFKDSSTADRVLNKLRAMETEYVLDLEDAVIVVRDQGWQSASEAMRRCVRRRHQAWRGAGRVMGRAHGAALHESPGWICWAASPEGPGVEP